jgi:uncharacterized delta-60 repeat protein
MACPRSPDLPIIAVVARSRIPLLVVLLCLALPAGAAAHFGSVDRSFGRHGSVEVGFGSGSRAPISGDGGWSLAVADDGSLITAGSSFIVNRNLPGGGRDRRFAGDGSIQLHFPGTKTAWADDVVAQPDGKLLVAGHATDSCVGGCDFRVVLARLTGRGKLDPSFGGDGMVRLPMAGTVAGLAVLPGGGILVASGTFRGHARLARLGRGGGLDRSFGSRGLASLPRDLAQARLEGMTVQAGGRPILLTRAHGGRDRPGKPADGTLVRYTAAGRLDRGFGAGGLLAIEGTNTSRGVRAVVAQPDGKLLLARSRKGAARQVGLIRLLPDGDRDAGYRSAEIAPCPAGDGFGYLYSADLALLPGGGAALAATCEEGFVAARFLPGGAIDRRFGNDGMARFVAGQGEGAGASLAVTPGGGFAMAGLTDWSSTMLVRYGRRGPLATFGRRGVKRFANKSDSADYGRAMAISPGGGIVLAGDSEGRLALAWVGPDGHLVRRTQYGEAQRKREGFHVGAIGVQRDGKVLVAARSRSADDAPGPSREELVLLRFGRHGHLDRSFGRAGIARTRLPARFVEAHALAIQRDGKIVVAGDYFSYPKGTGVVVRYRRDGSPDAGFGRRGIVALRSTYSARDLDIGPGGTIAVVGSRSLGCPEGQDNCRWRMVVLRLRRDGRLDRGFGGDGTVSVPRAYGVSVFALRDGVLAVGSRTECRGLDAGNQDHPCGGLLLARTTDSGRLEPSFGGGGLVTARPRGAVRAATVDPAGRIFVATTGGHYSVAAYAPDGSRLLSFGRGGVAGVRVGQGRGEPAAIGVQPGGGIVVGGRAVFAVGGMQFALARLRGR